MQNCVHQAMQFSKSLTPESAKYGSFLHTPGYSLLPLGSDITHHSTSMVPVTLLLSVHCTLFPPKRTSEVLACIFIFFLEPAEDSARFSRSIEMHRCISMTREWCPKFLLASDKSLIHTTEYVLANDEKTKSTMVHAHFPIGAYMNVTQGDIQISC